jgi:membrane protease YdiL (CAAX protease family)
MHNVAPHVGRLAFLIRFLGPVLAAGGAAWALDWQCRRRGLQPPGFARPWRRLAAAAVVFAVLWVAIFRPLGDVGLELKLDLANVSTVQLFLLHIMMAVALLGWFALGFAGRGAALPPAVSERWPAPAVIPESGEASLESFESLEVSVLDRHTASGELPVAAVPLVHAAPSQPVARPSLGHQLASQFGFVAASVPREIGLGLLAGLLAWVAVLATLLAVAFAVWAIEGEGALPKPSAIVPWIAALPLLIRLLVSLSAGVVEETFFRGFLQPRIGIVASTAFFVVAHVSYGQPLMLVGITLLSLIFAFLVRWRQTIWPSIAAHSLFDGIQLLVIIPIALRVIGQSAASKAALAVACHVLGVVMRRMVGL